MFEVNEKSMLENVISFHIFEIPRGSEQFSVKQSKRL